MDVRAGGLPATLSPYSILFGCAKSVIVEEMGKEGQRMRCLAEEGSRVLNCKVLRVRPEVTEIELEVAGGGRGEVLGEDSIFEEFDVK